MNSSGKEFEIGKVHKIWKTARKSEKNKKIIKKMQSAKSLTFSNENLMKFHEIP